jgi:hypothetical protein
MQAIPDSPGNIANYNRVQTIGQRDGFSRLDGWKPLQAMMP